MKTDSKTLKHLLGDCVKLASRFGGPLRIESNGHLMVNASDGQSWLERSMESGESFPPFSINARRLWACVDSPGEIQLEHRDNKLILSGSSWKQEIQTSPPEGIAPVIEGQLIGINHGDLSNCLEMVSWAWEESIQFPFAEVVQVQSSAKLLECFSGDGKTIAVASRASICSDHSFAIPGSCCSSIIEALSNEGANLRVSPSRISVEWPTGKLSVLLSEHKWPDVSLITKAKTEQLGTVDPISLYSVFKRFAGMGEDGLNPVTVSFSENEITVEKKGHNSGSASIPFKGTPRTCRLDANRVAKALKHFLDDSISIGVTERGVVFGAGDKKVVVGKLINQ